MQRPCARPVHGLFVPRIPITGEVGARSLPEAVAGGPTGPACVAGGG